MFLPDVPINNIDDDALDREDFSKNLADALLSWKESESLVIALCGEWGAGKSSIINLTVKNIENLQKNGEKNLAILRFNPWEFSDKETSLSGRFFNQIADEFEINRPSDKSKKIAKQLRAYGSLLRLAPQPNLSHKEPFSLLFLLALFLLTTSWPVVQKFILGIYIIFYVLRRLSVWFEKLSKALEDRFEYQSKSLSEIKEEIKKDLSESSKNKSIIIIDDIDRLSPEEVRNIFKLIRVNADFPNTIYLLAFDREIIEKNLEEYVGIPGKNYLNKIVQVSFDVPFTQPDDITAHLLKELYEIINELPDPASHYFDTNDSRWFSIYNEGYKDFFKNIRDIKRYINSLKFNISQMHKNNVMEVNAIDFFALEAIRVFAPSFYAFMRNNRPLFTSMGDRFATNNKQNTFKKEEIEKQLNKIGVTEIATSVQKLIFELFPQVHDVFNSNGIAQYPTESHMRWNNELRLCSESYFDIYFTMVLKESIEQLSQFETKSILSAATSAGKFEKSLQEYIAKRKIKKVFQRFNELTYDKNNFSGDQIENIIEGFFNISDNIEKDNLEGFSWEEYFGHIVSALMSSRNHSNNFSFLKRAIQASKGLYGPIFVINHQSILEKKPEKAHSMIISPSNIKDLELFCAQKIDSIETKTLLSNRYLPFILCRWKEWAEDPTYVRNFIKDIERNNTYLLAFIEKFSLESRIYTRQSSSQQTIIDRRKTFDFKHINAWIDLKKVKTIFQDMKDAPSYKNPNMKETIELFLEQIDSFFNETQKKDAPINHP